MDCDAGVERRDRSWDWVVLLASRREISCGEVRRVSRSGVDIFAVAGSRISMEVELEMSSILFRG